MRRRIATTSGFCHSFYFLVLKLETGLVCWYSREDSKVLIHLKIFIFFGIFFHVKLQSEEVKTEIILLLDTRHAISVCMAPKLNTPTILFTAMFSPCARV